MIQDRENLREEKKESLEWDCSPTAKGILTLFGSYFSEDNYRNLTIEGARSLLVAFLPKGWWLDTFLQESSVEGMIFRMGEALNA